MNVRPTTRQRRNSATPSSAPSAGRANAANSRAPRDKKFFGIVQGGNNAALRAECAKAIVPLEFDGYAIGGVSVGEPEPEMFQAIEMTVPHLPRAQGALRDGPWARPRR